MKPLDPNGPAQAICRPFALSSGQSTTQNGAANADGAASLRGGGWKQLLSFGFALPAHGAANVDGDVGSGR